MEGSDFFQGKYSPCILRSLFWIFFRNLDGRHGLSLSFAHILVGLFMSPTKIGAVFFAIGKLPAIYEVKKF